MLGSIATTRGFIGNDPHYLAGICVRHACNYLGSRDIGRKVGELVRDAIEGEGYDLIPDAEKPVLISLKGASAAGKSSPAAAPGGELIIWSQKVREPGCPASLLPLPE